MPRNDQIPTAEVAQILGKDVRTIHRMIERGVLRAYKAHTGLRAPYLVERKDVERLAAQAKTAA